MNAATWILGAVSAVALVGVVVLLVVLLGQRGRHRRDLERLLGAARVERADLLDEMEEMRQQIAALAARDEPHPTAGPDGEAYLITTAGQTAPDGGEAPNGVVLRATLGEPIVKAAAFGHGVRRAFSAESRNRMRFAMRQHTRLSRKERRREQKIAWREYQERQRAQAAADSPDLVVESP